MSATSAWLPRPRERDALRLFALPFAGGGSAPYHALARHVRARLEVVPVLLPGRERRLVEEPFRDVGALADALARELAGELDAAPFALFGHSLGALVAFELARRLLAAGRRAPLHLFASACRAPQRVATERPIHALPDEEFLAAIEELGGMPPEVRQHSELLELVLPALRADFEMYEAYRFDPSSVATLDLPVTALGGEQDLEVPRPDLEAWAERTAGAFDARWFPGGHFFLLDAPADVAHVVDEKLAAAAGALP